MDQEMINKYENPPLADEQLIRDGLAKDAARKYMSEPSMPSADYIDRQELDLRSTALQLKMLNRVYQQLELDEILSVLMMPRKWRRQWERKQRKNLGKVRRLEEQARALSGGESANLLAQPATELVNSEIKRLMHDRLQETPQVDSPPEASTPNQGNDDGHRQEEDNQEEGRPAQSETGL